LVKYVYGKVIIVNVVIIITNCSSYMTMFATNKT